MRKKHGKPDAQGKLSWGGEQKKTALLVHRVPPALKIIIEKAAERETRLRRHKVTVNEWLLRAAIDRIGELYGTSIAAQLYRNYFNGIVMLDRDVALPCTDERPAAVEATVSA